MSYKVKLSKKNQGAIPVDVLWDIGLTPNQENELVIYKNFKGDYFMGTQLQIVQGLRGSLGKKLTSKVKSKLAKMTPEEILEAEKNARYDYLKAKYTK